MPSGEPEPAANFAHRFKIPDAVGVVEAAKIEHEKSDILAWIVRNSFGYVKDELIAFLAVIGVFTAIIVIILIMLINILVRPPVMDIPEGRKVIYPPGEPPRLDRPIIVTD